MHLWNTCFDHDEDFCAFFFERHFEPEKAIAVTDDSGEVYAALHFFDGLFQDGSRATHPVWYVYGVATLPSHRKKGYASMLLRQLIEEARSENIAMLYLTAETEAWHLYESVGFCRVAELSRTEWQVSWRKSVLHWKICSLEKFKQLRGEYTDTLAEAFLWRGRELDFMYSDACRDGQVLCTFLDGREYYAVVRLRDNELTVTETDFPREKGDLLAESIASRFRWNGSLYAHGRKGEFFSGCSVVLKENFYIGHILSVDGTLPSSETYMNLLAD
ncbi:MAG: GNAT family N-acetyltransferase [Clostridia bacterium]|nr:GNAT family N-acetyltransferase [Clostridia bacterium]